MKENEGKKRLITVKGVAKLEKSELSVTKGGECSIDHPSWPGPLECDGFILQTVAPVYHELHY